jgi:topoisomerase IA-like protein
VYIFNGVNGVYTQIDKQNISLKTITKNIDDITIDDVLTIIEKSQKTNLWEGSDGVYSYTVNEGKYGKYINVKQIKSNKSNKSKNIKLPKNTIVDELTLEEIIKIVNSDKKNIKN